MYDSKPIEMPNSKESEMMVLGCMLSNQNSLNFAVDTLEDWDFYYTEHKLIFQTIKSIYLESQVADTHIVCEELKRKDKLNAAGGVIDLAPFFDPNKTRGFSLVL